MIKRDDVRRALVLKKIPVHFRHLFFANEMDGQFKGADVQLTLNDVKRDLAKQPRINAPDALAVQQREHPAHVARPRCSS